MNSDPATELAQAADFDRKACALKQLTNNPQHSILDALAHLCREKAALMIELDNVINRLGTA